MGRRKIRVYDTKQYDLSPDEVLVFPGLRITGASAKPRFGQGSGRAGGARSSIHTQKHIGLVHHGTTVECCPICKFGIAVWKLWSDSRGGYSEEWENHWLSDQDGLREFLSFVASYEAYSRTDDSTPYSLGCKSITTKRQTDLDVEL